MPDKKKAHGKSAKDKSDKKKPDQGTPGQHEPAANERAPGQPAEAPPAANQPAPAQQLGDTPTPPWQMPSPEEKAEAKPVRHALREALSEVDSPEKADAVVEELKAATAGLQVKDVADAQPTPATTAEAAEKVAQAGQAAPTGETTKAVLAETAAVLTTAKKPEREAVSQAAQEIFNAQQQGAPEAVAPEQQDLLRAAVLKHLRPLDALDARLFLAINHLPHTPALNRFFYFFTFVFTGGAAWFVLMGIVTIFNRKLGWRMIRESAAPLALATWTVEYPVKSYFKRRRPFIDIIQAIVIGKKPGTWSFPSGHSATAFGGAWIFSRYLPRLNWLWYTIAGLTAFSRIYLGDHYPGDVASGSVLGVLLSVLYRMLWPWKSQQKPERSPGAKKQR